MSKPKIHTMKELSKAIGVSRPTLARYFEDETSVLPSTSSKIKDGLETVDYVYNFLATRQNRKSTGIIGVVVPDFTDLFYASLLDSIEVAAKDAGFTMITQSSHGGHESEENAIRKLRSMNVDGAIVAPLAADSAVEVFLEASDDFPIVFVDSMPSHTLPPKADFVGTNNKNSVGVMVDYLCRSGSAPIFLNMPLLNTNAIERHDAYLQQMQKNGFDGAMIETPEGADSWQFEKFGFAVMDDHFGHGRYVNSTILCANDRIAIGAIRAANTHGLFVIGRGKPEGLRIAGHDDHPLSQYMFPALTTVAQEIEGIGEDAIDLLMNRIRNGSDGSSIKLLKEGALKIRESA